MPAKSKKSLSERTGFLYEKNSAKKRRHIREKEEKKMLKGMLISAVLFTLLLVVSIWRSAARHKNQELDDREQLKYMQAWRGKRK